MLAWLMGIVIGFIFSALIGVNKVGTEPTLGSNFILLGKNGCYHIHHWISNTAIIVLIILTILLCKGHFTPVIQFIIGLLLGSSIEDLHYRDWRQVSVSCNVVRTENSRFY